MAGNDVIGIAPVINYTWSFLKLVNNTAEFQYFMAQKLTSLLSEGAVSGVQINEGALK